MPIQLTTEQEKFVQKQLATGSFGSPDEVVDAAFRTLAQRNERLQEIQSHIQEGIDQLERGDVSEKTFEDIAAQARSRFSQ